MAANAEGMSFGGFSAGQAECGIWLGPQQTAALDHLAGPAALKVLLGPPSSGKSTLLRHFHDQAVESVVLPLRGPQKFAESVLQALLSAADLGASSLSAIEQRNLLMVFIEQRRAQGRHVVICMDDIREFSADAWREINRLRLVQFTGRPLIDLVVVATEADMSRAPLEQLLRDSATCSIEAVHFMAAPTDAEIADYIRWQLARRSLPTEFSAGATQAIVRLCGGRFGVINALVEAVLSGPASACPPSIHSGMVARAAAELIALKKPRKALRVGEPPANDAERPTVAAQGRLLVTKDGKLVRTLDLQPRLFIGRGRDNDLRLDSRFLSRHHAAIMQGTDGSYLVADLNSTNGLMVNGKVVSQRVLRSGDVIGLSEFRVKVELVPQPRKQQTQAQSAAADERDTDIMPVPIVKTPSMRLIEH